MPPIKSTEHLKQIGKKKLDRLESKKQIKLDDGRNYKLK
jgi:hypothetical protein